MYAHNNLRRLKAEDEDEVTERLFRQLVDARDICTCYPKPAPKKGRRAMLDWQKHTRECPNYVPGDAAEGIECAACGDQDALEGSIYCWECLLVNASEIEQEEEDPDSWR